MDALLDAILTNPDDDEVRLVYADTLEAAGDPRGELIQLQCRLARTHDPALALREDELLREHGRTMLAGLLALKLNATFTFERGFVARMGAHFPSSTTRTAEVLALAPLLEHFELTVHGQADRMQLARPRETALLARARSLSIKGRHRGNTRGWRGPIADFTGLAAIPLARLRSLRLEALRPKANNIAEFLRTLPPLDDVRLHLRFPVVESRIVLPAVGRVCSLDFGFNSIDVGCVKSFLDSDRSTLESLQLDGMPSACIEMLQSVPLPALRVLSLRSTPLREMQLDPANWKHAPKLERVIAIAG